MGATYKTGSFEGREGIRNGIGAGAVNIPEAPAARLYDVATVYKHSIDTGTPEAPAARTEDSLAARDTVPWATGRRPVTAGSSAAGDCPFESCPAQHRNHASLLPSLAARFARGVPRAVLLGRGAASEARAAAPDRSDLSLY